MNGMVTLVVTLHFTHVHPTPHTPQGMPWHTQVRARALNEDEVGKHCIALNELLTISACGAVFARQTLMQSTYADQPGAKGWGRKFFEACC